VPRGVRVLCWGPREVVVMGGSSYCEPLGQSRGRGRDLNSRLGEGGLVCLDAAIPEGPGERALRGGHGTGGRGEAGRSVD